MTRRTKYSRFSQWFAQASGRPLSFTLALGLIIAWIVIGPVFHYSDTWQLVMNTVSSIVTFLMVFLIQRSQNKDALAMHVKLNEIVKAVAGASDRIVNVEDLSEEELQRLQARYQALARRVAEIKPGMTSEIPLHSS